MSNDRAVESKPKSTVSHCLAGTDKAPRGEPLNADEHLESRRTKSHPLLRTARQRALVAGRSGKAWCELLG
jgi:hypothetical protein